MNQVPLRNSLRRFHLLYLFFLTVLLCLSYYTFKAPLKYIPIAFYDDGEMLYHAFSFAQGAIPYLQDMSHHFLGYIIPFVAWGKIFGFDLYLLREYGFFNQVITALGIFLILRRYIKPGWATISALLYISAREPFVSGFFIQYEINLLFVYLLLFTLRFNENGRFLDLALSFFIAGLAFSFDQRALCLSAIPVLTLVTDRNFSFLSTQSFKLLLAWLSVPLALLLYLYSEGALYPFYEQTIIYPAQFRIASLSWLNILGQAFSLHSHLFESSLALTWLALISYLLIAGHKEMSEELPPYLRRVLLILPPVLFFMAGAGSRDFDYYTIIWFPYLAIMVGVLSLYVERCSKVLKLSFFIVFLLALVPPYIKSIVLAADPKFSSPSSDGLTETAAFLQGKLKEGDSVSMWGYRMDLFVAIGRLFPHPFTSQIMIHPDRKITGPLRETHIYKPYEERYLRYLRETPPTYFVVFKLDSDETPPSRAEEATFSLIRQRYELVFEVSRTDFRGGMPTFKVYQLRGG